MKINEKEKLALAKWMLDNPRGPGSEIKAYFERFIAHVSLFFSYPTAICLPRLPHDPFVLGSIFTSSVVLGFLTSQYLIMIHSTSTSLTEAGVSG